LKKLFYILIIILFSLLVFYFLNENENEVANSSLPDYGEVYSDHGY